MYQSESVSSILPKINRTMFLPAMQREYVWTTKQICDLFDSLLRSYPISGFLFWKLSKENVPNIEFYNFLSSVEVADRRTSLVNFKQETNIVLILDGQQRLTSLLVGLKGTFKDKKTYKGKGSKTLVTKKLYLDILHNANMPDSLGNLSYKFEFRETGGYDDGSYWFEISRVLDLKSENDLNELIASNMKNVLNYLGHIGDVEPYLINNLTRLYQAICVENVISYFSEENPDEHRILEIFVRANSGGTALSKSDLLLSTMVLHWHDRKKNAKDTINKLIDELNNKGTKKNKFDKDFLMKACLVLLEKQIAYNVKSFTKETCLQILNEWEEISGTIRKAVSAINYFGVDEKTLTSMNSVIPIAYFLHKNRKVDLMDNSIDGALRARKVRVWFISLLLNGVLSGSSDGMLTGLRKVIHQETSYGAGNNFPFNQLNEEIERHGEIASSDEKTLRKIFQTRYGDKSCFLALSLIYDEKGWGAIEYSIDHLFPQSFFKHITDEILKERCDSLANLALIPATDNSSKNSRSLKEWLSTRDSSFFDKHLIPKNPMLWENDKVQDFLAERSRLIRDKLRDVLDITA